MTDFAGLAELEDQENYERNKISKVDFVAVKFVGKKNVKHFVVELIELNESGLQTIYLRKPVDTSSF